MEQNAQQCLTRRQILAHIVSLRSEGRLYHLGNPKLNSAFFGSADRYAEIACLLQGKEKVLDVGSGSGLLLSTLASLGHQCWGLDLVEPGMIAPTYARHGIQYRQCNVEVDDYPFPDDCFDAVTCCQVLEHFSHSPLPALGEMRRVLKPEGVLELDVPNVACFRNRWRMLRGKNITWNYREHYLRAQPLFHRGFSFYPVRHNREFTRAELRELLLEGGFSEVSVQFLKDRNLRTGWKRLLDAGSAARNLVPSLRKSLIATARKRGPARNEPFTLAGGDSSMSPWAMRSE
jgi:ubiquinone/menaquinone biosynthesis C-methylase UbiE